VTGKLVRDRIPERIRADGGNPVTRVLLDQREYAEALLTKLDEELAEMRAAVTAANYVEEIGDVIDVLVAIVGLYGETEASLQIRRIGKQLTNGAFRERIWLEDPKTPLDPRTDPG
jgi:predicted house-cleaning noncanonical NTP pyrophosphatase (MazG superfamily)